MYSRSGKISYNSDDYLEETTIFGPAELKKWLTISTKKEQLAWKWPFLEQKDEILPYYSRVSDQDSTLIFESRFESGNLMLAAKISENEYKLVLQNDSLSQGNTQCIFHFSLNEGFYFKVSNTRKDQKVQFHIMNLAKKGSLYEKGMKIVIFSQKMHSESNKGWFRGGENITYKPNKVPGMKKILYNLSFSYTFQYDNDEISFAFSEPYTITDLNEDLSKFEKAINTKKKQYIYERETLCFTVGGAKCEILTLTKNTNDVPVKKSVILSARVHPGETVGSWMMKGILEFLVSGNKDADSLLEKYIFKIIPCLNPDGVIQGNYRCSLAGCDLNRRYAKPSKLLHPTVYFLKSLVRKINHEHPVEFYCDLHGHSKKKDVFAYGNTSSENIDEFRIYPYILSKLNPFFSYKSSRFVVQKSKASTARIAMWKELNIPTVYTIEASFFGPSMEIGNEGHFNTEDLIGIGKSICQALEVHSLMKSDYLEKLAEDPLKNTKNSVKKSNYNPESYEIAHKIKEELAKNPGLLCVGNEKQKLSEVEESSSGSDSNPSGDDMDPQEIIKLITPKKDAQNNEDPIIINNIVNEIKNAMNEEQKAEIQYPKTLEKISESENIFKKSINYPLEPIQEKNKETIEIPILEQGINSSSLLPRKKFVQHTIPKARIIEIDYRKKIMEQHFIPTTTNTQTQGHSMNSQGFAINPVTAGIKKNDPKNTLKTRVLGKSIKETINRRNLPQCQSIDQNVQTSFILETDNRRQTDILKDNVGTEVSQGNSKSQVKKEFTLPIASTNNAKKEYFIISSENANFNQKASTTKNTRGNNTKNATPSVLANYKCEPTIQSNGMTQQKLAIQNNFKTPVSSYLVRDRDFSSSIVQTVMGNKNAKRNNYTRETITNFSQASQEKNILENTHSRNMAEKIFNKVF